MNYIRAMQRLAQYRKDLRESNTGTYAPYNIVKKMKDRCAAADRFDKNNVAEIAGAMLDQRHRDPKSYLREQIASDCSFFGEECAQQLEKETVEYEERMLQIQQKAQQELDKGNKKSSALGIFKGYLIFVFAVMSIGLIVGGLSLDLPGAPLAGLALGAVLIFALGKKSKPNEELLTSLAAEAKKLTKQYYSKAVSVLEPAYEMMEAKRVAALEADVEEVKAAVGERVFFLFENTPYSQQEYFMQLGMTATTEDDFNAIAQECLKADKSEQLVNLQNMINRETRDSITQGLEKLNRTTQQMHEDAEFRARQQAAHNAQMEKQAQRDLANQAKALDELKKARRDADDREYRMRHQ